MKSKTLIKHGRKLIVFNNGEIFREQFEDKNGKSWPLKQLNHVGNLPVVSITVDGKNYPLKVRELVAEAFLPDYDPKFKVINKDGNGQNNAPSNLAMVPADQYCRVRTRNNGNYSSKYRGITWCKREKRWMAQCWVDGKNNQLGRYGDEKDAARAYNKFAKKQGFVKEALNKL